MHKGQESEREMGKCCCSRAVYTSCFFCCFRTVALSRRDRRRNAARMAAVDPAAMNGLPPSASAAEGVPGRRYARLTLPGPSLPSWVQRPKSIAAVPTRDSKASSRLSSTAISSEGAMLGSLGSSSGTTSRSKKLGFAPPRPPGDVSTHLGSKETHVASGCTLLEQDTVV